MLMGTESVAQECEECGHVRCKECDDWAELAKVHSGDKARGVKWSGEGGR